MATVMPSNAILREFKIVERRGNWVDGAVLWTNFSDKTPIRYLEYRDPNSAGEYMAKVYFDKNDIIVGWYFSAD